MPSTAPSTQSLPLAPEDRISPVQLSDIVRFLADRVGAQPEPECLWGLHQEMLLNEGRVLVNQGDDGKKWALEVLTTQGTRIVLGDGKIQQALPEGVWEETTWRTHDELDPKRARQAGKGMISSAGVGLLFESNRTLDEVESANLVEAMWGFSCHPYLGRRIVADLNTHGRRAATVMPHLLACMEMMQDEFGPFGVSVKRCWPMPSRGKPEVPEQEQDVPMPRRIHKPR